MLISRFRVFAFALLALTSTATAGERTIQAASGGVYCGSPDQPMRLHQMVLEGTEPRAALKIINASTHGVHELICDGPSYKMHFSAAHPIGVRRMLRDGNWYQVYAVDVYDVWRRTLIGTSQVVAIETFSPPLRAYLIARIQVQSPPKASKA